MSNDVSQMGEEYIRVKTFMRSMNLFELTNKEKQSFLKDKRLSQAEKIILECSMLVKDYEFKRIIDLLTPLSVNNVLVDSQRHFILGLAYNNSGHCEKAIPHYQKAVEILSRHGVTRYEYNALVQLFFAHLNLQNQAAMATVLDRMQEIKGESVKDKISYLRCRFNYHLVRDEHKIAGSVFRELEELTIYMHPSQAIFHRVDKFIYHLKLDHFRACEQTLEEMKKSRSYSVSANYRFMKTLLNHIMHGTPIYLYDNDFKDVPILYYQVKVIQLLGAGELQEARSFWNKLHELNPQVYSSFLEYCGEKCLFSVCLKMHLMKEKKDGDSLNLEALGDREKIFIKMLSDSTVPVKKEDLFYALWGKPLEGKDELFKLSMLVSRLKKKTGLAIKTQKGCYLLVGKNKQEAS